MHFKNKIVWITGASSGIGREIAVQLAAQNAMLILTSSNEKILNELSENLLRQTKCYVLPFDLLNVEKIQELVTNALKFEGKIDYVIQSAGISQRALATETLLDVNRKLMELNFFAPVAITQAILPHFNKINSGNITVISSIAGLIGFPQRSGYAASKHALKGYFETLQTELYHTNITISIIYPGRIDTNISKNAITANGSQYGISDENNKVGLSATVCAKKIIDAIKENKKSLIIAKSERLLLWIWWFLPAVYYKLANAKGLKKN